MDEFVNHHIPYFYRARTSWLWPLYIPTCGRAGKAPLLQMLNQAPRSVQRRVHLIVLPEEQGAYHKAHPWAAMSPPPSGGLGVARFAAINHARQAGHHRIVMMDDDIRHLSLLQRIPREGKPPHTRRYSSKVSSISEPESTLRTLGVACTMASSLLSGDPGVVYGAARNALFSGGVDTRVGAKVNGGQFPSCVLFIDVDRYPVSGLPEAFHFHGEDLAMSLECLQRRLGWFTLTAVAYDQDGALPSQVPLDPMTAQGRQIDMDNALVHYPSVHQYLKASYKNKLGGVMRIGIRWNQWYKDSGTTPVTTPMDELF